MLKQFNDKYISSLKPKEKKHVVREGRGFALQILPSGVKTFMCIFTLHGRKRYMNLGNYPHTKIAEARQAYNDAYSLVSKGIDPQVEAAKPKPEKEDATFGHFAKLYLEWSEQHHSLGAHKINKLSLENDVLPFWKALDVQSIRRRDAIELLERVASRSPGQTNNVLKAARGVFNYALEREYTEYNPMLKLNKVVPALKATPKDRTLTDAEIKIVWPSLPAYLKIILLTAQRPGEVAGMHSREIQIGAGQPRCQECRRCGWWTIPKERVKNNKEHMVYLTPAALELIGSSEGFIFPSPITSKSTTSKPIGRMALSRHVHRKNYYDLPRWTPHDLRRTARTYFSKLGVPEVHSEAILNHGKKGMVKIYDQWKYQDEKKAALIKWEAELSNLVRPDKQHTDNETHTMKEI